MADGGEAAGGGGAGLEAELLGAGVEVPAADAGVGDGGGGDHHLHRDLGCCGAVDRADDVRVWRVSWATEVYGRV